MPGINAGPVCNACATVYDRGHMRLTNVNHVSLLLQRPNRTQRAHAVRQGMAGKLALTPERSLRTRRCRPGPRG